MSSILEALRKSEAERAAGTGVSAPTARESYQPKQRSHGLILMVLLVAALGTAGVGVWRYAMNNPNNEATKPSIAMQPPAPLVTPEAPAAELLAGPAAKTPTDGKAKNQEQATETALPATKPISPGLPTDPSLVEVPDPEVQLSNVDTYEAMEDEPPPTPVAVTTVPTAAREQPNTDSAEAAIAKAPGSDSLVDSSGNSSGNSFGNRPATTPDTSVASEVSRPPKLSAPGSRLPSLAQLPNLRKEIGDLDMSMLVFNSNPARRFALINGQRMKEGDELSDGIRLLEIRRNECVFAANGQQFVLRNQ